jgi:hypothetical protein
MILWFVLVGLSRATELATVIAAIVAVVGLAVAVYTALLARRAAPRTDGGTHNTISGGTFHGAVYQGRKFRGVLRGDGPEPDRATPRESDDAPPPG